jgi:hypothetical protein
MTDDGAMIGLFVIVIPIILFATCVLPLVDALADRAVEGDLAHRGVAEATGVENLTRTATADATTFVYVPHGDEDAVSFRQHGYYADRKWSDAVPLYVDHPREPVTYIVPLDFAAYAQYGLEKLPWVEVTITRHGVPSSTAVPCRDRAQIDRHYDFAADLREIMNGTAGGGS